MKKGKIIQRRLQHVLKKNQLLSRFSPLLLTQEATNPWTKSVLRSLIATFTQNLPVAGGVRRSSQTVTSLTRLTKVEA